MIDLKNNGPLVSVVMPSYNTPESFLRRATQRIGQQSLLSLIQRNSRGRADQNLPFAIGNQPKAIRTNKTAKANSTIRP